MGTDKSVQNQKVFVTLESVLALTSEYLRVKSDIAAIRARGEALTPHLTIRKQALEFVFQTLNLPVHV